MECGGSSGVGNHVVRGRCLHDGIADVDAVVAVAEVAAIGHIQVDLAVEFGRVGLLEDRR